MPPLGRASVGLTVNSIDQSPASDWGKRCIWGGRLGDVSISEINIPPKRKIANAMPRVIVTPYLREYTMPISEIPGNAVTMHLIADLLAATVVGAGLRRRFFAALGMTTR